jgi:hypothetical protein
VDGKVANDTGEVVASPETSPGPVWHRDAMVEDRPAVERGHLPGALVRAVNSLVRRLVGRGRAGAALLGVPQAQRRLGIRVNVDRPTWGELRGTVVRSRLSIVRVEPITPGSREPA